MLHLYELYIIMYYNVCVTKRFKFSIKKKKKNVL
jgi:hypothetical protein